MQFLNELGHLYKSVCNKLECFQVAEANFYNNSKKIIEFSNVSVSKVSREFERVERKSLLTNLQRELLLRLVPLLGYGVL
jgi:hypothetical protein